MKINQIISEMATTAGAVASVAKPMGEAQKRSINGLQPVEKLTTGKSKKKGPYANSLSEGRVKELSMDLKAGKDGLSDEEFKKKYGKTKQEMRKSLTTKPQQKEKQVTEAHLEEEDKIIAPGKGSKLKTGLHGKNDKPLMTGFVPPFKANGLWVSDKRGKGVLECTSQDLAPVVAKALNAYVSSANEGVIAAGGVGESTEIDEKAVSKAQQRFFGMAHAIQKGKKIPGASKELKDVAKSMSKKSAHDYAATKHKGLPEKVKKD